MEKLLYFFYISSLFYFFVYVMLIMHISIFMPLRSYKRQNSCEKICPKKVIFSLNLSSFVTADKKKHAVNGNSFLLSQMK